VTYVYRITMTRTRKLGIRTWNEKRVIPMATKQRLGTLLAYHRENDFQDDYVAEATGNTPWSFAVERAPVGEWEDVSI
jgi:hypothetical protein